MKKSAMAIVSLAALLISLSGNVKGEDAFKSFGVLRPKKRLPAPSISLKTIVGRTVNTEDLLGHVVVLNFWASWCAPCRVEMPSLNRLDKKLAHKGLIVLTVAGDRGFFAKKNVKDFVKKYNLTLPIIMDPGGKIRKSFEVAYLPTTYIIGRDGRITGKVTGDRVWDGTAATRFFLSLLEAK